MPAWCEDTRGREIEPQRGVQRQECRKPPDQAMSGRLSEVALFLRTQHLDRMEFVNSRGLAFLLSGDTVSYRLDILFNLNGHV